MRFVRYDRHITNGCHVTNGRNGRRVPLAAVSPIGAGSANGATGSPNAAAVFPNAAASPTMGVSLTAAASPTTGCH